MKWLKNLMTWLFSLFCLDSFNADKHILLDFPRNGLGWFSRIVHKLLIGLDTFKALGHCARNQFVSRLSKIKLFSSLCKFFKINLFSSPLSKLFHRLLPNPFLKQVMAPQLAHLSMIMMRSNWWHRLRWKKEKLILIDLHLDLFSFHGLCTLLEDQVQCSTTVFAYGPGQLCCRARGWRSKY